VKGIILRGLKQGVSVSWTLGKIVFPVTILVTILRYTPVLPWIIDFLTPLMKVIGLPGEAAMPLVLGNALNLYAGIGAIVSFDFTVKEVFILAIMLSFSHNLFIESTVAAEVGVNWWFISGIRVGVALISAFVVNLVWSGGSDAAQLGFLAASEVELTTWTVIGLEGFNPAVIAVLQ